MYAGLVSPLASSHSLNVEHSQKDDEITDLKRQKDISLRQKNEQIADLQHQKDKEATGFKTQPAALQKVATLDYLICSVCMWA